MREKRDGRGRERSERWWIGSTSRDGGVKGHEMAMRQERAVEVK